MGRSAAVFDLDRTLIRGASGPVITEALQQVGLLPGRSVPGQSLVFRFYDLVGETRPAMLMTRQLARASAGWSGDLLRKAGVLVAERLIEMVQPFARSAIEEHRAAGRELVLATTTPEQLVRPLAEELGISHVLATRYEEAEGLLTGRIDGGFIWGGQKCAAFEAWAEELGVLVEESYAYSDSWFDRPLLGRVGHPVAVNPDPRLAMLAVARRWPVVWFDVPPGVPKLAGVVEPQRMIMPLARRELLPWVRFDLEGLDRIPDSGPVILVANHRSYFDPLAIGYALAKKGRPARFLGKKEVFDVPVVGNLVAALGGIRVDRGTGSGEPLERAAEALLAGELVAIMPQGTIPRGRAFFDPVLRGRWGASASGDDDGSVGGARRHLGHREGLAPQRAPPEPAGGDGSAHGPRPCRRTGGARGSRPGRGHGEDHGRDHRASPAGRSRGARADGAGAGDDFSTRIPGRSGP